MRDLFRLILPKGNLIPQQAAYTFWNRIITGYMVDCGHEKFEENVADVDFLMQNFCWTIFF